MRGVVLWPDPATEECVLSLWAALADLGVAALSPPSRPHITLLVADQVDADVAVDVLSGLEMGLPVDYGAVGLFPPAILHLAVTPTRELLALQATVPAMLGTAVRGLDHFYAVPGRWQPHLTLAPDVPDALLAEALTVIRRQLPLRGTVEWLGIEEVGSHHRWAVPPATSQP